MNKSPFDRVDVTTLTAEEREKLSDPNYRITGKMEEVKKEKTFGSRSESKDKDPEDKIYIIFIVSEIGSYVSNNVDNASSDVVVDGEFSICKGRSDAYTFIKNLLMENLNESVDILSSSVLVEGLSCTNSISMFKFMKHCENLFPDDDFNIDEYINYEEEPNNISHISASGNSMTMANAILNNINKENDNNG